MGPIKTGHSTCHYVSFLVTKINVLRVTETYFLSALLDMAHMSLQDHDGSSGASDQDTLAPLLHSGETAWPMSFPYQYPVPHAAEVPHCYSEAGGGSAGSQHSEGEMILYCAHTYTHTKRAGQAMMGEKSEAV